ncbi:MAG: protein kinase [Gemmataceae bacterium]
MTTTPADVKSIFGKALERPDPAGRAAYLAEACGGDDALRAEVDGLLAALDEAGAFLNRPGVTETFGPPQPAATADFPGDNESVGCVIAGRYKLVEEIGEGGMGTVWMAQQTEPVRRAVAVKVIKAGMDSKAVLARFEAERQALAMMDHPNIAKVLDAGATDSGRPFFVMELVKGVPITKFCDERKLTPRGRLELFVPVCQAIQHAHQKGVIHRDIKPSNVLVALYDDRPVPKVIDFGVAKAAGQSLTDKTLMTGFGAVVGTPEYMSPEQASFNQMDVDTRSDIYALGVLLYELLTGATPVDRRSMEKAAFLEVLRIVREVEPPRPSTKLSSDAALPSIAANRGIEPGKLANLLRGELDWVVMKALEKDRSRRYDTANGLVRDIQRYLADEVVEARPPSAGYRVRKFVRRNKGRAVAASLILAALAGGVVVATLGLVRAEHARRAEVAQRLEAVRERDEKEQARADAVAEKDRAEREKRRADEESAMAKAVNEFLQKDLLGRVGEGGFAGGPNVPPDPNVTACALLDRARPRVSATGSGTSRRSRRAAAGHRPIVLLPRAPGAVVTPLAAGRGVEVLAARPRSLRSSALMVSSGRTDRSGRPKGRRRAHPR